MKFARFLLPIVFLAAAPASRCLGFQIVKVPQGANAALSAGSFGHGGTLGTHAWADPRRDAIFVLMIQRGGLASTDASEPRRVFQDAAAAALR